MGLPGDGEAFSILGDRLRMFRDHLQRGNLGEAEES